MIYDQCVNHIKYQVFGGQGKEKIQGVGPIKAVPLNGEGFNPGELKKPEVPLATQKSNHEQEDGNKPVYYWKAG